MVKSSGVTSYLTAQLHEAILVSQQIFIGDVIGE
jgi:hypothetical protein